MKCEKCGLEMSLVVSHTLTGENMDFEDEDQDEYDENGFPIISSFDDDDEEEDCSH